MEVYFLNKLILYQSDIRGRNESQNIEGCSEQNCRRPLLISPICTSQAHFPSTQTHYHQIDPLFYLHLWPKLWPTSRPKSGLIQQPRRANLLFLSFSLLACHWCPHGPMSFAVLFAFHAGAPDFLLFSGQHVSSFAFCSLPT